jgi:GT2 family glycosyltransferase
MTQSDVSIVILSFRRPEFLRDAIRSVLAQTHPFREILVVDNVSDRSEEVRAVCAEFPSVVFHSTGGNLGFTGGMNRGIALASGERVLLTEDDLILHPDCLRHLVEEEARCGRPGLVSGIVRFTADNSICCAGGHFHLRWNFRAEFPHLNLTGEMPDKRPYDSGYVAGCTILARTDYLRWLEGFREEFFVYCEDVDLCLRVLQQGHMLRIVPESVILHQDPPGKPISPFVDFHKRKNFMMLYLLHAPLHLAFVASLKFGCMEALRGMRLSPPVRRARWAALFWYLRNIPHILGMRRRRPVGGWPRVVPGKAV